MTVDVFVERPARVRQRFFSALESRIQGTYALILKLTGAAPNDYSGWRRA